jgi:hypothetical protein
LHIVQDGDNVLLIIYDQSNAITLKCKAKLILYIFKLYLFT